MKGSLPLRLDIPEKGAKLPRFRGLAKRYALSRKSFRMAVRRGSSLLKAIHVAPDTRRPAGARSSSGLEFSATRLLRPQKRGPRESPGLASPTALEVWQHVPEDRRGEQVDAGRGRAGSTTNWRQRFGYGDQFRGRAVMDRDKCAPRFPKRLGARRLRDLQGADCGIDAVPPAGFG